MKKATFAGGLLFGVGLVYIWWAVIQIASWIGSKRLSLPIRTAGMRPARTHLQRALRETPMRAITSLPVRKFVRLRSWSNMVEGSVSGILVITLIPLK